MDILVNVANQKLKIATNLKSLVAGTQEFVRFVFNTSGDWDGLATFAQFMQDGVAYNQYLDENKAAYLPAEIGVGTCTVMLYGSDKNTMAWYFRTIKHSFMSCMQGCKPFATNSALCSTLRKREL